MSQLGVGHGEAVQPVGVTEPELLAIYQQVEGVVADTQSMAEAQKAATDTLAAQQEGDPDYNALLRTPAGEFLSSDALVQVVVLGHYARKVQPVADRTNDTTIPFTLDKSVQALGGTILPSRLTELLTFVAARMYNGEPLLAADQNMVNTAKTILREVVNLESDVPFVWEDWTKEALGPITDVVENQESTLATETESSVQEQSAVLVEQAKLIAALPTEATLDGIAGMALVDTLRGLQDNVHPHLMTKEEIRDCLQKGVDGSILALLNASKVLDIANTEVKESNLGEVPRLTLMANIAGIGRMRRIPQIMRGKFSRNATDDQKAGLIVNAHQTMLELLRVTEHSGEAIAKLRQTRTLKAVKLSFSRFVEMNLEDIDSHFYGDLDEFGQAVEPSTEATLEMLALEQYKNARLQQVVADLHAQGVLSTVQVQRLERSFQARLENFITHNQQQEELAEIQQVLEQIYAEIQGAESPYAYGAKAVRAFEGGVGLVRDMTELLDGRELGGDERIARALSMLILQSEQAKDPNEYFDNLAIARNYIQQRMGDIAFLGASDRYKSPLIETLQWIDEMLDSGKDTNLANKRLERFLERYCLGIEESAQQTETVVDPNLDLDESEETAVDDNQEQPTEELLVEPVDEYESPEVDEPETPVSNPTKELDPQQKAIIEAYIGTLSDILQNDIITHADVDVFPPGESLRNARTMGEVTGNHFIDVDPKRLENLVSMAQSLREKGKTVELMWTNPTSWSPLPHFELYVRNGESDQTGVCILENPVNGNATYAFMVDGEEIDSWQAIAGMQRSMARGFGASAFVHPPKGAPTFSQHYDLKLMSYTIANLGAPAKRLTHSS
jgi:hypothetical protein